MKSAKQDQRYGNKYKRNNDRNKDHKVERAIRKKDR